MLRRLLLLGLALCGTAQAGPAPPATSASSASPAFELTATPAWKGWSRPGRATELDVRLGADTAQHVTLDLLAGRQTVRAEIDLLPGRVVRLHLPVGSGQTVAVSAAARGGAPVRLDVGIAQSESPVLGVALADAGAARADGLTGFHTLALAAGDLPRNASAYASIDALVIDAATLGLLDERQLGALLVHAAGCGRVVVLNTDAQVRRLLEGAAGCGGRALMNAASLVVARDLLGASLTTSLPPAMAPGTLAALAAPVDGVWTRVAVAVAAYLAAALLMLLFFKSILALLLTPALAALAALLLLHATPPASRLVVWSEGESGAAVARYQALHRFPGLARERVRVPLPPQLAAGATPCDTTQAMRLDLDARLEQPGFAEFESRLFRQTALCYSGSFPVARAFAISALADGTREIVNTGSKAWPPGRLLVAGRVQELPALGPGARTTLAAQGGGPRRDAVARTAMTRTSPGVVAALWPLDLAGVAALPAGATGWLLVSEATP